MKKLVIIVAVLMMVVGGAVSVMKSMELGPFAPAAVGEGKPAPKQPGLCRDPRTLDNGAQR